MKLQVLDTNINIFMEIDKSKLTVKEDGTSKIILKTDVLKEGEVPSILLLELNEKHTKFIQDSKLEDRVLFIQGSFEVLKNKKEVPFAKVKVFKVISQKKNDVLSINKLRNRVTEEFKKESLKNLKEKYKEYCIDEEIKGLKEAIEQKDILKEQRKINEQEIAKYKLEAKILNAKLKVKEKSHNIKWYSAVDDFVDIDVNKIELLNEIFKKGNVSLNLKRLNDETKDNHVLVRKIDNDKYELIMGIASYLRSKILNKTVKAHITDLDRESFIKKINNQD